MPHSKIKSVYLTNFMSIKSGEIHFPDSGIVQIVGYNDSGKSAFLRALDVVFTNSYSRSQKSFIHDGTHAFQIDVVFDDGITIRYEKGTDGHSLYEMYKTEASGKEELLYTTRLGETKYEKVTEVPPMIRDYLDLVTTPDGVSLNSGAKGDKLLLVQTTGSENYASLSSVLKSEDLARATKLLNKENNRLEAEFQSGSIKANTLKNSEDSLIGIDSLLVSTIQERAKKIEALEDLVKSLKKASSSADDYVSVVGVPKVPTISVDKLSALESAKLQCETVSSEEMIPSLNLIDYSSVVALEDAIESSRTLFDDDSSVPDVPLIPSKSVDRVQALEALKGTVSVFTESVLEHRRLKGEYKTALQERSDMLKSLKEQGYVVTECPNCHELSIVDQSGKTVTI